MPQVQANRASVGSGNGPTIGRWRQVGGVPVHIRLRHGRCEAGSRSVTGPATETDMNG